MTFVVTFLFSGKKNRPSESWTCTRSVWCHKLKKFRFFHGHISFLFLLRFIRQSDNGQTDDQMDGQTDAVHLRLNKRIPLVSFGYETLKKHHYPLHNRMKLKTQQTHYICEPVCLQSRVNVWIPGLFVTPLCQPSVFWTKAFVHFTASARIINIFVLFICFK